MTNNNMYFIANWKMHGNARYIEKANSVIKLLKIRKYKNIKIIYCPPYTLLKTFFDKYKNSNISIGSQNCHPYSDFGPFTGSINSKLIKSTGSKYIIIGHSENRNDGDTNIIINKKIKSALRENLKVIFCIGETLTEKKKNITNKILKKQISIGLKKIKKFQNIIFAYEPVWSIGTGLVPKRNELIKNLKFIRKTILNLSNIKNIKILYGGSVNPNNAKKLAEINEISGFLIGGASLNAKNFIDIIKKSIN